MAEEKFPALATFPFGGLPFGAIIIAAPSSKEIFGSGGYAPVKEGKVTILCVKNSNGNLLKATLSKEFPYPAADANEEWLLEKLAELGFLEVR